MLEPLRWTNLAPTPTWSAMVNSWNGWERVTIPRLWLAHLAGWVMDGVVAINPQPSFFFCPPYSPGLTRSQSHQVRQHRRCLGWSLWFGWPWCRELHTVTFPRNGPNWEAILFDGRKIMQLPSSAVPVFFLGEVWGKKSVTQFEDYFTKGNLPDLWIFFAQNFCG